MNQRGNDRHEMRPETRAAAAGNRHVTDRLAAGAAVAAFLIAGARITAELLPDDGIGLAPYLLSLWWGAGGAAVAALAIPAWLGRRWPRRLLGVCSLAGSAVAVYWLFSEDQSDRVGLLVGVSTAVLLAAAALAAAAGERVGLLVGVSTAVLLAAAALAAAVGEDALSAAAFPSGRWAVSSRSRRGAR